MDPAGRTGDRAILPSGDPSGTGRLSGPAVAAGLALGAAWLSISMVFLSQVRSADVLRSLADRIHIDLLETRRREKDFLLRSLTDPVFFREGVTPTLLAHRTALRSLEEDITDLAPLLPSGGPAQPRILEARRSAYAEAFGALLRRYRELGDRDSGLKGALRAGLADLERRLPLGADAGLARAYFQLQADETDFVLHPDPETLAAAGRHADRLLEEVRRSRPDLAPEVDRLMERHRRGLAGVLAAQEDIGLTEERGLQGTYRNAIHDIEPMVGDVVRTAAAEYAAASRRLTLSLAFSSLILGLLLSATFVLTRAARIRSRHLGQTTIELSRSNTELQQFAYVASHDLQEPLRAVAGCVQLLQQRAQGQLDEKSQALIQHAVDGCLRMQTLIEDLLTLSRVGTQSKPPVSTDAEAVLRAALENLAVPIRDSGAVITSDPLPTLTVDPTQMTQVFQNLVGNAIKFRSGRSPQIHVGAVRHQDGWRFSVRDNGIGIDRQYFERIFRVFQRLHSREEYPGSGIGLAVCEKIVLRHGGRIWLESELDRGSTFYFSIPDKGGAV
ncbi:MAG TPA: ATP-binding protein [Planctomycetota bacterium]|nr:ATP-binding protein [Planctomycetota bacterium]